MTIMLCIIIVSACLQALVHSETSVGQTSKSTTSCGLMIENILRLERAVTNMSWELKLTKANLETTKSDLVTTKSDLVTTKQNLASVIDQRFEKITNLTEKREKDREILFKVKLRIPSYALSQRELLKFDEVTENKGKAYNLTTGIFTVPITGNYLCWANIISTGMSDGSIRLMKDGQVTAEGYTGRDQTSGTATITDVAILNKGNQVWFDLIYGYSRFVIYGKGYSTYGCFLMNQ